MTATLKEIKQDIEEISNLFVVKGKCFCGKNKKLKKCSKCNAVYYCSTECQLKDWKVQHKKLCHLYPTKTETIDIGIFWANNHTTSFQIVGMDKQSKKKTILNLKGLSKEVKKRVKNLRKAESPPDGYKLCIYMISDTDSVLIDYVGVKHKRRHIKKT